MYSYLFIFIFFLLFPIPFSALPISSLLVLFTFFLFVLPSCSKPLRVPSVSKVPFIQRFQREYFLCILAVRLHDNRDLEDGIWPFWNWVSKCKFLKRTRLSSLCKLWKRWPHLHVQSIQSAEMHYLHFPNSKHTCMTSKNIKKLLLGSTGYEYVCRYL